MKKQTKKNILEALIPLIIIGGITLAILYSSQQSAVKKFEQLQIYSKDELDFLNKEGFLPEIKVMPKTKEEAKSLLKPMGLIEQNLDSEDENFEVLATKLDLENNIYQMAFKLENNSNQEKQFYLIPISDKSQTQFREIRSRTSQILTPKESKLPTGQAQIDAETVPLAELYDVEKHRAELRPELDQAYSDIENNGYQASPVKITLEPNSKLVAKSQWEINTKCHPEARSAEGSDEILRFAQNDESVAQNDSCFLKPVYFLVYGSAGGAKEELTIINVHSHPQAGDYWTVAFGTKGIADLYIIPDDQDTIDDLDFVRLICGGDERTPQILEGDVIFYPSWECLPAEAPRSGAEAGGGTAEVIHLVNVARDHRLKFIFGEKVKFAYNSPGPDKKIEQQINIIDQNYSSTSTDAAGVPTDNSLGLVLWDANRFSDAAVYFEAVIRTDNASGIAYALLCPDSGCATPTSTLTSDTGQQTYKRYRSVSTVTLTDDEEYTVRIKSSNTSYTTYIQAARLIVLQQDAVGMITQSETQVEVGANETETSESYVELTDKKIYNYDSSKWTPAPSIYFEATLKSNTYDPNTTDTVCQTTANDATTGAVDWTNVDPNNYACGQDTNRSTATLANTISKYLKITNFSFSPALPETNCTVLGIEVKVTRYQDINANNDVVDNHVYIVKAGTIQTGGDDKYKSADWSGSPTEETVTYGGSADTWSVSWQCSDINNEGFGVAISAKDKAIASKAVVAYINNVTINVYYRTTGTASAALYTTAGDLVASSDVSVSSTTWTRQRTLGTISLGDTTHVVRIKSSSTNATTSIANAKIILYQTDATAIDELETVHQYINRPVTDADNSYDLQDFDNEYNPANWQGGNFAYYFESTMKMLTWSQVGNSLTIAGSTSPALAALSSTDVAYIAGNVNQLRTYRFNGTDWSQVGNGLNITNSFPALAALNSTDVAFIDDSNDQLRTYRFNGTDWSQVGNGLNISVTGIMERALAALNSTDVAYIDEGNEQLRTYRFNGTDWSQVGNSLNIDLGYGVTLAALNSTDVAFIDGYIDQLRTYRFNGTDWAQVGNSLTITGSGNPALAALNSTDVAFIDSIIAQLRTYTFPGTAYVQLYNISDNQPIDGEVTGNDSQISSTNTSYERQISLDLSGNNDWPTGTDNDTFDTQVKGGPISSSWLKIYVSGLGAVNNPPTISAVEKTDPVEAGRTVTFYVDWNDDDVEGVRLYVCKTTGGNNSGCGDGEWCSHTSSYSTTDPLTCNATTSSPGDVGSQTYYAYVCDNDSDCSSESTGTFTVEPASTGSMRIQGGTRFQGGVRVK